MTRDTYDLVEETCDLQSLTECDVNKYTTGDMQLEGCHAANMSECFRNANN